nr:transglutaminase family protein [Pleomorphomonas koreensis]
MAVLTKLTHVTRYVYDRPVLLSPQLVRLRPAPHGRTKISAYALKVAPERHVLHWQQDPHGNWLARLIFSEPTTEFSVIVDLLAEIAPRNPFDFFIDETAADWPFAYAPDLARDLAPFLALEGEGELFAAYLATIPRERMPTTDFLVGVNRALHGHVAYEARLQPGVQSPEETLARRAGSCRDSGWLLVQLLRRLGVAARFVSGYLIQLRADVETPDGPAADSADLHAWAEAYIPGAGWIGLDPTSGLLAGEGHIPLAATPHYRSAAPISGVYGAPAGTETDFSFRIEVARLDGPGASRPIPDAAWVRLDRLGAAVDAELQAGGARLATAGEFAFVPAEDDGAGGRGLADDLLRRLAIRLAPGGLLHHGGGPDWALSLHWRHDGKPIWRNPDLTAPERQPAPADAETACALARGIARRLGLSRRLAIPAYEDPIHLAEAEESAGRFETPEAPVHLAGLSDAGPGAPAAYVLPLGRCPAADGGWQSEAWHLRRGRLYLVPGEAPAGLRLPLAALPAEDVVRTALSVEPHGGRLCVFLPPVDDADGYLTLLAAVEATAEDLSLPVHVGGHPPPADPRFAVLRATPEAGAVVIGLPPAAAWTEVVTVATVLYEEARSCGLGTERFAPDGRAASAGGCLLAGGNPFIERPDVLRSLVLYVQRHPSLSYLFFGPSIGSAGRAPRLDEGRPDALSELEIALSRLPAPGEATGPIKPFVGDFLAIAGRGEIDLGSLLSPDGAGVIACRALATPLDARLALAQHLLFRALIAWFWREPQQGCFTRHGTALLDRFLLEHFVWRDFLDVLADLERAGYAVEPLWYEAQREARFPYVGGVERQGVSLELRGALEPWRGDAARPVERLQVRVAGFDAARYVLACNGRRVPLVDTGHAGIHVGGVRFPADLPLIFDIVDRRSMRSLGGAGYSPAFPGGQPGDAPPVNAREAAARRLARFQEIGHTPGIVALPSEEPPGEFPTTLDLRRY